MSDTLIGIIGAILIILITSSLLFDKDNQEFPYIKIYFKNGSTALCNSSNFFLKEGGILGCGLMRYSPSEYRSYEKIPKETEVRK